MRTRGQKIGQGAVGALTLAQTLGATALGLMDPKSDAVVDWLWIGAGVCLVVFLVLLFRWPPYERGFDPEARQDASQEGTGNAQAVAARDAIAQSGDGPKFAQQGMGNTLNVYEGGGAHKEDDGRIFLDLTPEELTAPFEAHPTDDAQRMIEKYLGNWLRVEGMFHDREKFDKDSLFVTFHRDAYADVNILMFFEDPAEKARISLVQRGQPIKVAGSVERIGRRALFLKKCELT